MVLEQNSVGVGFLTPTGVLLVLEGELALLDVVYHCMDGHSHVALTVYDLDVMDGCLSGKNRRFQAVPGGRWGVTGTVVVVTTVTVVIVEGGSEEQVCDRRD